MENMNNGEIMAEIMSTFNGRDPLADLDTIVTSMTPEQKKQMILIACNQIGIAHKGSDYESNLDGVIHIGIGAERLINAYFAAGGEVGIPFNKIIV